MMVSFFLPVAIWWLIMEALGWLALPLAFRLFRGLPDRGYAFSKPLGLLLTSYLFWLLVTFRFLANRAVAILFVLCVVGLLSWWFYLAGRREGEEGLGGFLRRQRRTILVSEVLFTLAFALWALVRAYNPEIAGTEKPMEFAFLNATLRSEYFPPHDPWLSGLAISYYYFGYLMMALLTRLSGLPSEVTFNLGIALLFSLTVTGAFSLAYNLVRGHERGSQEKGVAFGLLGALLVAIVGNLEGLLEALHSRGLGSGAFWEWIDIKELASAPVSGGWFPTGHWWWWRASRVIKDVLPWLPQQPLEVIDEFPFFSFLLGDMHPHLLALPFFLLVLAWAFNLLRSAERVGWPEMIPLALSVGALGFLNAWDLPTCLLIVIAAYAVGRYARGVRGALWELLEFGGKLVALSILLYLPFYLGFRSQAGGLLPVLFLKTRFHQYLIIFGLFLFASSGLLAAGLGEALSVWKGGLRRPFLAGGGLFLALLFSPLLLISLALFTVLMSPERRDFVMSKLSEAGGFIFPGGPAPSSPDLWALGRLALLEPLLSDPWLTILLALLLSAAFLSLWRRLKGPLQESGLFALLLVAAGLGLTYLCEYIYIQDVFMTRMNTVFKFYYQAWVLLALASTYGVYYVTSKWRGLKGYLWQGGLLLLLAASLIYPWAALPSKMAPGGTLGRPTLDGMAYLETSQPDDYAAIRWLRANVEGAPVILEATGGSYTPYGRVSAFTGLPTLLGWGGHELQWRGNYDEPGRREPDIEALYTTLDQEEALRLLDEYDIRYVYLGSLEIDKYKLSQEAIDKWRAFMEPVYERGEVIIYGRGE